MGSESYNSRVKSGLIPMRQILGWSAFAIFAAVSVFNGLIMLVSPRAWFRLPSWLAFRGSLTEAKYGSGWGAIQVRLLGAIFLVVPLGLLYNSLSPLSADKNASLAYFAWFAVGVAAVHMAVNALFMLVSPRAWFRLPNWIRVQGFRFGARDEGSRIQLRVTGALILAFVAWVLYESPLRRIVLP